MNINNVYNLYDGNHWSGYLKWLLGSLMVAHQWEKVVEVIVFFLRNLLWMGRFIVTNTCRMLPPSSRSAVWERMWCFGRIRYRCYIKRSLEEIDCLNTTEVLKNAIPSNVPQLRPTENFWTNLKRRIHSNNVVAKSEKLLIEKMEKLLKNIQTSYFCMAKAPAIRRDMTKTCEIKGVFSVVIFHSFQKLFIF